VVGAQSRVAARVRELAAAYEPPTFEECPGPDAALLLCAVDHRTGYTRPHRVGGRGPYDGSAVLWHSGCLAERLRPGTLSAAALRDVEPAQVEELFRADGETVAGAEVRARLWRDLSAELLESYDGSAAGLIEASEGRLGGVGGLLERLSAFEAYSDPLQKKSHLFAKIAARRGWLTVADPDSWEVSADNVLMRLALRAGLVEPSDDPGEVRAATRAAFKRVAEETEIEPPLLDDLLWELGKDDPALLGSDGGADLVEPPRPPQTTFY
jgi:hypothetical protein